MQIFKGEHLQVIGKAGWGCKFLKRSICKIEKKQVADENSRILTEKSICKGALQADADTTVLKKASARELYGLVKIPPI